MEPGQRPFDDPAQDTETAAVWAPGFGDDGDDALRFEAGVAGGGPIGPIALDDARLSTRPSRTPGHGGQRGDQGFELHHVVDIRGGEVRDERYAARIGDEMVLRALLTAIGWVRSSFFPPRNARTEALSITVHR